MLILEDGSSQRDTINHYDKTRDISTICISRPKETYPLPSDKHCSYTQNNSSDDPLLGGTCSYSTKRCENSLSACSPIPYSDKTNAYKEHKKRIPAESNPSPRSNGCLNRGSCMHDKECIRNGCGNHCTSHTIPRFVAICPEYSVLTNAFCGCVNNRCTWFVQR